jgi:metacaspase-1
MKYKWLVSLLVILAILVTSVPVYAAAPPKDGFKPVPATDIEIVKKVTLKGGGARGGKPAPTAATGILSDQCTGSKYAIVIGINNYPGTANDLQYCVNDAVSMKNVLTDIYKFQSVDMITDKNATYENISSKIQALSATAGADDEVVFFFSGHGAKGKANDGDMNSTDQAIVVNKQDGTWGYIWDGQLKSWFSGFKANRIVFIFDSCLAGGMSVLQGPGRIVNMACSASGLSYEDDLWGGGHGQFTYYFVVQGMQQKLADTNSTDSKVSVEEAFDYARSKCQYQAPVIADGFTNDLNLN